MLPGVAVLRTRRRWRLAAAREVHGSTLDCVLELLRVGFGSPHDCVGSGRDPHCRRGIDELVAGNSHVDQL